MAFSPFAIFAGFFFYVIVVALFDSFLIGIPVILVGGLGAFTRGGVQLDLINKMYRKYTSYYGIKTGKWKSFSSYPFLAVLSSTVSKTTSSKGQTALTTKDKYFDLCLLTKTHRKKIFVKRHENMESAISDARLLANELEVEYTKYTPVVSDRTKARR